MERVLSQLWRVLVVLYDDVFLRGIWIGDETLTWVHKHYVIARREGRQSQVERKIEFATWGWRAFYREEFRRVKIREILAAGDSVAVLRNLVRWIRV